MFSATLWAPNLYIHFLKYLILQEAFFHPRFPSGGRLLNLLAVPLFCFPLFAAVIFHWVLPLSLTLHDRISSITMLDQYSSSPGLLLLRMLLFPSLWRLWIVWHLEQSLLNSALCIASLCDILSRTSGLGCYHISGHSSLLLLRYSHVGSHNKHHCYSGMPALLFISYLVSVLHQI